MMNACYTNVTI